MLKKKVIMAVLLVSLLSISLFVPIVLAVLSPPTDLDMSPDVICPGYLQDDYIIEIFYSAGTKLGDYCFAQTFTVSNSFSIESVGLQIKNWSSPGMLLVSIRCVDPITLGPTGDDLVSGVIDGDTLPVYSDPRQFVRIYFNNTFYLAAGNRYAIVIKPLAPTEGNGIFRYGWGTYDGGSAYHCYDGVVWHEWVTYSGGNRYTHDFFFETYGCEIQKATMNLTWDVGLESDQSIFVLKRNSMPMSQDDGYKYFFDNITTQHNFTGVFSEEIGYNRNYSCRAYSGEDPFGMVTRSLEDGLFLTFMNSSTDLASSYFSLDSSSKVNGTYSIKFNNPSVSTGNISGVRHFENDDVLNNFSVHCILDSQDVTLDDVALKITPYNISGDTKNVTFYFDEYTFFGDGFDRWDHGGWRVVDGFSSGSDHYGYTTSTIPVWRTNSLVSTSYDGRTDGQISKVELRAKIGYVGDGVSKPFIDILPIYLDGNGEEKRYQSTVSVDGDGEWTSWDDITLDYNSPLRWSWSDVESLNCNISGVVGQADSYIACWQVEIRVTYEDYRSDLPDVVFYDNGTVYVGNNSLLASWVVDRVYNVTYQIFQDSMNVSITDYQGNYSYHNYSADVENNIDGFIASMEQEKTRNVYLDDWNEVNSTTVTSAYDSTYNWTHPSYPIQFIKSVVYSSSVDLSWLGSHDFYNWDMIRIQKSSTSYPSYYNDGITLYFGSNVSVSDIVAPSNTTYYSAWGYGNESGLYSSIYSTVSHTAPQLFASFSFSPKQPVIDESVTFIDWSSGNITEWKWSFGDGSTGVGKNQKHSYVEAGTYNVVLEIIDPVGHKDRRTESITVQSFITPYIPPSEDPVYPGGYSTTEMYSFLKADELSVTNNKIRIVVIDTGFTPRSYDGINMQNVQGYKLPSFDDIYDDNGHGTFCLYEILSLLQFKCPNAEIVSFKAFDKYGVASEQDFLDALDAMKDIKPDIVSISAGAIGNPSDQYSKKVKELRDSGIIVLAAAAGNLGPTPSSILSPACSDYAIAIGSYDPIQDEISPWSSRGPVPGVSPKPDLVAPGESIRGAWLSSEKVKSGTSMATPLIVGGSAVVIAGNKPLSDVVKTIYFWNPGIVADAFEDSLKDSCTSRGDTNLWGAGIPDFSKTSSIFFWKLIILLLIPIIIISLMVIFCVYWFFYGKRQEDHPIH